MKTYLNYKTGSRALIVLAVSALALTASACGGGTTTTTVTTSASGSTQQWANSVCTSFADWQKSLQDAKTTLTSGGLTKQSVESAAGQVEDATTTLVDSLHTLGAPSTSGSKTAKQDLQNFQTSMAFSVNKIKDAVNPPPSSASELSTAATTVKQAEATMVTALTSAATNLKTADPSGDLENAFKSASACTPYFQ